MNAENVLIPSSLKESLEDDEYRVLLELISRLSWKRNEILMVRHGFCFEVESLQKAYYSLQHFESRHSAELANILPKYEREFLAEPLREVYQKAFKLQAQLRHVEQLKPLSELSWNTTPKIEKKQFSWLLKIPYKRVLKAFRSLCKKKIIHHEGKEYYAILNEEIIQRMVLMNIEDPFPEETRQEFDSLLKSLNQK